MDTGEFMGHWTSIFNTIHSSMQDGLRAQAEATRAQAAAIEALVGRLDHLSAKYAKQKSRSPKTSKTTEPNGEEADDESDESDAPTEREIHLVRLQVRVAFPKEFQTIDH